MFIISARKVIFLILCISLLGFTGCNSGASTTTITSTSSNINALTEFLGAFNNTGYTAIFNYQNTTTSNNTCAVIIRNAEILLFGGTNTGGYNLNGNNFCDLNGNNCLTSNNSNTTCISGTQELSSSFYGTNPMPTTVEWNECGFNNNGVNSSFSAALLIKQGSLICNGIVLGKTININ